MQHNSGGAWGMGQVGAWGKRQSLSSAAESRAEQKRLRKGLQEGMSSPGIKCTQHWGMLAEKRVKKRWVFVHTPKPE